MALRIFLALLLCCFTSIHSVELIDLAKAEKKVFSQNGEDGILEEIFRHIGTSSKYFVEFGAFNGIEGRNTLLIQYLHGWNGLLLDLEYENEEINLHREFITAENINALFKKYQVPQEFDLLSIDIDFNDFYVWKSLTFNPRVVMIEYNATWLPQEDKVVIYNPQGTWDRSNYFGASILALYRLGKEKGYSLVYADKAGINLFFIRNDVLEELAEKGFTFSHVNDVEKLYRPPTYGSGPNGGHWQDSLMRPYVDSKTLLIKR